MKKSFKSKIDLVLVIPILILFFTSEILMIVDGVIAGAIVLALLGLFIAYLCRDTKYVITNDNKLRVKSGFLYEREIYIKSIKKVKPTHIRAASAALSLDRIEICYNRYGRIIVSPSNKTEFIKELKDINPRIRVEESDNDSFYHSVEERIEGLFTLKRNK